MKWIGGFYIPMYNQPWKLVQNRIRGAGGREIDKFRGITPPIDDETGSEAWIGSVTRVEKPPKDKPNYGCSEVYLPDGERLFLFKAIERAPEEILGKTHMQKNGTGLGMLIKYLDAQRQYGLQCHPTRPWAKKMWNSDYGKEESWFVIGTRDDTVEPAYILLGFQEGVTREEWEKYYHAGDLEALENLCHKIPVQVGETYFVGGGCPHALGEGCFVIEVQEPSDITLGALPMRETAKLWHIDFGEITPEAEALYDERLLGAYVYDGCTYEENLKRWRIPRKVFRRGDWGTESIVIGLDQTSFFSFTELDAHGCAPIRDTGFPQVAIVLEGSGKLIYDGGEMEIHKADELFFPYHIPNHRVEGNVKLILCHPEGVTYEDAE